MFIYLIKLKKIHKKFLLNKYRKILFKKIKKTF